MGDAATDDVELALRARAGCVESFAALAARHQVAIVHYVEALPVAGIATVLERSPAAVKLLLLRGRRQPPPIDKLPLPEELGARLLAGTAALAAEAVGLPRWNDLVDAGTAFALAGDDWPGSVTP